MRQHVIPRRRLLIRQQRLSLQKRKVGRFRQELLLLHVVEEREGLRGLLVHGVNRLFPL